MTSTRVTVLVYGRGLQFLPFDAHSAKRGIAIEPIVSRTSVCLSVCNVDIAWAYRFGLVPM